MSVIVAQQPATQPQLDEMTFNMFVDCGLNATECARQMGISRGTVKARVRRHSVRSSAEVQQ